MNQYAILACSDLTTETFDIYIDTVEAWTANEAIKKFFTENFSFKQMGSIRGCKLCTSQTIFRAFPILIDTSPRNDVQYILHDIHLRERRKPNV